ncbi:MAG: hypothetical protein ACTSYZ_01450 [Candidatus Helarchaeota archaeon]
MPFSKKRILIIGGGKVGLDALNFCIENDIIPFIIDKNPDCLVNSKVKLFKIEGTLDFEKEKFDKPLFLQTKLDKIPNLLQKYKFEYIIPAIPVHIMAKLGIIYLENKNIKIKPAPDLIEIIKNKIPPFLIHSYDKKSGILILSFMPKGEFCIPGCTEHIKCPKTGIIKEKPLYQILEDLTVNFQSIILRSEQLSPNLGGISKHSIKKFLDFINSIDTEFIIGTACMCHGVVNAFEIKI